MATVSTPRSRQARITRRAISPRFAMRMRWNMSNSDFGLRISDFEFSIRNHQIRNPKWSRGFDPEQYLVILDELSILDADLGDDAAAAGGEVVEDLHRLDLADDGLRVDA